MFFFCYSQAPLLAKWHKTNVFHYFVCIYSSYSKVAEREKEKKTNNLALNLRSAIN
jgi:hypothetical protein